MAAMRKSTRLKNTDYDLICKQFIELSSDTRDYLPLISNLSALLFQSIPDINWAGFYLRKSEALILGPFQGKIACAEIPLGKGVCGTAAARAETVVVADVHQFAGHIACDSASRSEIVIPLLDDGKVWGVLDIDAPILNRFDDTDRTGLEALAQVFVQSSLEQ